MWLFRLDGVISHWGIGAGILSTLLLGVFCGLLGRRLTAKNGKPLFRIFKTMAFYFLILFVWNFVVGNHLNKWYAGNITYLTLRMVFVCLLSVFLVILMEHREDFLRADPPLKFLTIVVPPLLCLLISIFVANGITSIFWERSEKSAFWISQSISDQPANAEENLKKAELFGEVSPFFRGAASLSSNKLDEAEKYFAEYGKDKTGEEKKFLEGIINWKKNVSPRAAESFISAGRPDLAILVLFADGKLDSTKFHELAGTAGLQKPIFREIETKLAEKEVFDQLEKTISEKNVALLFMRDKLRKAEEILEGKDGSLIEKANRELTSVLLQYAPPLPKTPKMSPESFFLSIGAIFSFWALLFGSAIGALALAEKKITFRLKFTFPMTTHWAQKILGQSSLAKKIILKIALNEKEKGIFSKEIEKIRNSFFPFDLALSLYYLYKTQKILANWKMSFQEKDDLRLIYQAIKTLTGKLIPQGDAQVVEIISGFRKKATDLSHDYLKNNLSYVEARNSLLEIFAELETVGDIIGARKNSENFSYYDLLGVKKDAEAGEIKKAYREIIQAIHPDRNQGNGYVSNLAGNVNAAYNTLSDKNARDLYDRQINFN